MKISDVSIEVIEREVPDTGLDSDLGRFSGSVEQGVLRILTGEGIEGNCFLGELFCRDTVMLPAGEPSTPARGTALP